MSVVAEPAAAERTSGPTPPPPAPIRLPLLLGYGVGQTGAQVFRDAPAFLLPAYLITALGVPPWMMGLVIFIPKLWIIACDPLVGAWTDRVHTPMGRRRPFLLAGALLCPISMVLLLNVPMFDAVWARAIYAGAILALATTAFSLFTVPYLALGAEMSGDSHQRARVMSYRLFFVAIGLLISIGVSQRLLAFFGGGHSAYSAASFFLAGGCMASMLGCFFATRGAPRSERTVQSGRGPGLLSQLTVAGRNMPFLMLSMIVFIQRTSSAAVSTVSLLFYTYISGHPHILLPVYVLNAVVIMISQPLWMKLIRRFRKEHLYVGAAVLMALNQGSYIFLRGGGEPLVTLPLAGPLTAQDLTVFVRFAITGFAASGVTLLSFSLFTDTVDTYVRRTGQRTEGAFAGIWSATEKLAFAAGPLVMGGVLSLAGFAASTKGTAAGPQPDSVIQAFYFGYAVLPMVVYLGTAPLLLKLTAMLKRERAVAGATA